MLLEHAEWILFGWILANQGGIPVPVVPALLGAGALAASGRLRLPAILAIAVGAAVSADLAWYGLGRWRGASVLEVLGRLSPHARTLVRGAQRVFLAHVGAFQFSARFLPQLNVIAACLTGAAELNITRFVCYGALSAVTWAVTWIGLGFLLGHAVTGAAVQVGIRLIVVVVAAFFLYLLVRRARGHRLLRVIQRTRIRPDDLKARLEKGGRGIILDVREADEVKSAPYALPCAVWISPDELAKVQAKDQP